MFFTVAMLLGIAGLLVSGAVLMGAIAYIRAM